MPHKTPRQIFGLVLALLLAACGGGSGGGNGGKNTPEPPSPPAPEPVASFSLSGTIHASPSQTVDGDTNDPASELRNNDTVIDAQAIPNPTTLGGYVNQPGTGAEGRSQLSGDVDDYFRVELLAGQRVTLLVADFEQADADLYLYNSAGEIIDFSVATGDIETLDIAHDGSYSINVFGYAGATNYVLAIGTPGSSETARANRHVDIIPWQTVIKYRGQDEQSALSIRERIRERLGLEQRAGAAGRARLMALRRGTAERQQEQSRLGTATSKKVRFQEPQLAARWETLVAIKALRRDPAIDFAEPNYRVKALEIPDDPAYPTQWHYPLINLPAAWDTTSGDQRTIVAVVDTGILSGHPDLAGQLVPGYDFVHNPESAMDGDGIDPNPEDLGNGSGTGSSSYHGTHVAGTIAAAGNNGRGVAGVAYSSKIMPLRALGANGAGTSYDVNQAIRFAAGLPNDSGHLPSEPANIINLSLGGGPFSAASQSLFDELRSRGIMVVAAAGNEASSQASYPASYDGVISVSAVNSQSRLTAYSNRGRHIDVAAPGGDNSQDLNGDGYPDGILSTGGSNGGSQITYAYTFLTGTSMAAPHVAGTLALMKSVNPQLSPADIDTLLAKGELSDDLGPTGRDNDYGHGLINAHRAVLAALDSMGSTPADSPLLNASASTLSFSTSNRQLEFELRNTGTDALSIVNLSVSQPWLTLTPVNVEASGLGTYRVSVERDELAPGLYSADILAQSTVNTVLIQVLMSVGGSASPPDVGVVYILLEDAVSGEIAGQFAASASQGTYRFSFAGVPAGKYQVYAGSDSDNDLLICDPGEACGAWLTLDQPASVSLDRDTVAIDFPIEYLVLLPSSINGKSSRAIEYTNPKMVAKRRRH